jgi:cobalamin-dependent methionine synthase I
MDADTAAAIKDNISIADKLLKPKMVLAYTEISLKNDIVFLENAFKIESADIAKLLKDCFMVYGIAVTIGADIENKRDDFLSKKETFNALILDSCGSVAAEAFIRDAYNQIHNIEKSKGNTLTKRYSCGYGDWRLEGQKDFLNWLGADKISINLTDGYMMKPEKSISALIGVKKAE